MIKNQFPIINQPVKNNSEFKYREAEGKNPAFNKN